MRWLTHLLERLGRDASLDLWDDACQDREDPLLRQILASGWRAVPDDERVDVDEVIDSACGAFFSSVVEGVSREKARGLVEALSPLAEIRRAFPSFNLVRDSTAYEALHMAFDGQATLVEALVSRFGKEGELIAYDVLREARVAAGAGKTGTVEEFIAEFTSESDGPSIFTAGLEKETVRAAPREAVVYVRKCEWARYFRERHPHVGYLMACSTDEVAYRAFNLSLRMQRTATLMEGGKVCDFRIYAAGD